MKKLFLLMISVLLLAACGGGGGGGSSTASGTTALDTNDISTATGTYNVVYMDFYYPDGTYFTTDNLDQFTGEMTIDIENNLGAYRIEWHDSYYGDFLDYGQSALTDSGESVTWENAYLDVVGDYEAVFYYDNLCTEGICVNAELRIRKISDDLKPLLSASTSEVVTQSVQNIKSIQEVILEAASILE